MTGAAEHFVFVDDVFGVGRHEELARIAEVEFFRLVAEEFAMNRAPNETTVGVDVDLRNAEFRGREVLFFIDAAGVFHRAAGVVDTSDPFGRNRGGTVHDEREVRFDFVDRRLDFFQNVEVEALVAREFEGAVRGADGDRERVDAGLFDEFGGLGRVGQFDAADDVFFNAAELAEFGFDDNAFFVRAVDDAFRDFNVLREFFVRSVDHDGAVEAAVDAVVADFFGAVVEVNGEDSFREDFIGGADHAFEEVFVGVGASAAGDLDDERSAFRVVVRVFVFREFAQVAAEQTDELFEVVDVVRADRVFAVSGLEQFFSRNDH